jgi:hypothetical protein
MCRLCETHNYENACKCLCPYKHAYFVDFGTVLFCPECGHKQVKK